jgi:hypothetical protein
MSQENVKLAYRATDAFNRRDLDAFLALMDDDVDAVSRIIAIEGGLQGHTESVAGGITGSTSGPTTTSRFSKCDFGDLTVATCARSATAQVATRPLTRGYGR